MRSFKSWNFLLLLYFHIDQVVKAEDASMDEKKKVVESYSDDLENEFSEANAAMDTALGN